MATKILLLNKGRLNNGAHNSFCFEIYSTILPDAAALSMTEMLANFKALIDKQQTAINRQRGSIYTEEMMEIDKARDNALGSLVNIVDAFRTVPDETLAEAARQLYIVIKPYIGVGKHEMRKETAEITGLTTALGSDDVFGYIETLNLAVIIQKLRQLNNQFKVLTGERVADNATRADVSDIDMLALRAELDTMYGEIADTIYAMAMIGTTEQKAIAEKIIPLINEVVLQYKDIIARQGGKKKEEGGEETPPVEEVE